MTSLRKAQTNRLNALRSTGPKTPHGKDASSKNALKHGILSQEVLLPGEDKAVFLTLGESLWNELAPVGDLESLIVDRIISAAWRLRRLSHVETGMFAWELYNELAEQAQLEAHALERDPIGDLSFTEITNKKRHEQALQKAEKALAQRNGGPTTLGAAFLRDAKEADAFSKLSRYETTIERTLYRALHELERLQAVRKGVRVPPPTAVDVDVVVASADEA